MSDHVPVAIRLEYGLSHVVRRVTPLSNGKQVTRNDCIRALTSMMKDVKNKEDERIAKANP